jgi:hypothetical protein
MLTQHFIGYVTCLSRSSSRKPRVAGAKWLFLLFLREGLSLESLSFLARPESGCLRWKVLIVHDAVEVYCFTLFYLFVT